jgi:hypothetical protein
MRHWCQLVLVWSWLKMRQLSTWCPRGVERFKSYIGGNSVQNPKIDRELFSFHFLSSHKSKNVPEARALCQHW